MHCKQKIKRMRVPELIEFIAQNVENYPNNIRKIDIEEEDRWGYEYEISHKGDVYYYVGETTCLEDDEEWAQAETNDVLVICNHEGVRVETEEILNFIKTL